MYAPNGDKISTFHVGRVTSLQAATGNLNNTVLHVPTPQLASSPTGLPYPGQPVSTSRRLNPPPNSAFPPRPQCVAFHRLGRSPSRNVVGFFGALNASFIGPVASTCRASFAGP
uniref:Uncharacterized protein n=1 Tax=Steinernema glaseri TaxID=37863 RepID=A0A1I8A8J7_9BILA